MLRGEYNKTSILGLQW